MARQPVRKASEVLKRYIAGERDFRGVNLRGQSFKRQNLSGADFSEADIHSTNFTGATLRGTNFTGVKCGLQKRWAIPLIILSWLLTITSFFYSIIIAIIFLLISDSSNLAYGMAGWTVLIFIAAFFILIIRLGIRGLIVSFAISFAGILCLAGIGGFLQITSYEVALSLLMIGLICLPGIGLFVATVSVAFAFAFTVFGTFAAIVSGVLSLLGIVLLGLATGVSTGIGIVGGVSTGLVAGVFAIAGMCISWRALNRDMRDVWVLSFAIAFAAIKGTSFFKADLTDANFTEARLKSTDFRKAKLICTCWRSAEKLDHVRSGNSYLKNISLQQLLITNEGQNQNFDHQDLRGVNLQGANLTNASFIDTDLSQADLQGATLFEAKLVQTNLDKANLSNANLTGAYIEDWGITRSTIFDGVKGDYVYHKLPTKDDRDPNRMPPSQQGNFGENDLYLFVTSVLDTLDLYHRQNINAGISLTVLKGLTEDYPVKFELVGIEKRGDSQYVMKLKVFGQASHFQLQREYYARYEQTLPLYDPKMLMPDSENMVAEIIKTVTENRGTHIEYLNNQGIFVTGGKVNMSGERNIEIKQGNYNENIQGNYYEQSGNLGIGHMSGGEIKDNAKVAGVINEGEKQNLAEAAAEIQALLQQLEQAYPTNTTTEQMVAATKAIEQIESNPTWKQKAIAAFKQGSLNVIETHPIGTFVVGAIKGWKEQQAK